MLVKEKEEKSFISFFFGQRDAASAPATAEALRQHCLREERATRKTHKICVHT
jgi:hypothetical protein